MIRTRLTIDPAEVGAALAHVDDAQQAKVFEAFCKELLNCCGTAYAAQTQMAYVNKLLTEDARTLLSMFSEKI